MKLKTDFKFTEGRTAVATYKTARRESLLEFLKNHPKSSFTVREIVSEMEKHPETQNLTSGSTIYRLLRELEHAGTVTRTIDPENREYVYTLTPDGEPPVNMRCKVCGKVYSADSETSRRIKEDIAGCGDVAPGDEIELLVKCKKCRS